MHLLPFLHSSPSPRPTSIRQEGVQKQQREGCLGSYRSQRNLFLAKPHVLEQEAERENTSGCCSGEFLLSRSRVIISFVSSPGFSQRASVSEVISLKKAREGCVVFVLVLCFF